MPFEKGVSGNPLGARPAKICHDALRLAAMRVIDGDPDGRTYLNAMAHELMSQAAAGDKDAMAMVMDRLDGKPTQAVEHTGDGQPMLQFLVQLAEPEPGGPRQVNGQPGVLEHQAEPDRPASADKPDASKA